MIFLIFFSFFPKQELLETRIAELEDALLRLQDQFNKVSIMAKSLIIIFNIFSIFFNYIIIKSFLKRSDKETFTFTHFIGRLLTRLVQNMNESFETINFY